MLAARGALVVDADVLAREVLEPGTPGLAAVLDAFGPSVLRPDGTLDRPRLGALVFSDEAARARLNGIVHPLVGRRAEELIAQAPPDAVVVHDVPLLVENALHDAYDLVVVVDTDEQTQLDRLTTRREMTVQEARARMRAQASRRERLAVADVVVDNSGSLADLERQVAALWETLMARSTASGTS